VNELLQFLDHKAYNLRVSSLLMTSFAGSGHPTSCLSAADLVAAIFFHAMRYDPKDPKNPDNDRFILSKGHASPLLYAVYKELGILSEKDLLGYRSINSVLEGHPTRRFPYTEAATGALGIGLSVGTGIALTAKMDNRNFKTYVLVGDGEVAEGAIWEAAELATHYNLNNLIGVLDCNRLGQSTESINDHHVHRYEEKFKAFGWKTYTLDGHNMQRIVDVLDEAAKSEHHPVMLIAKTIKGYGVVRVEDKEGFHGKAFPKEELNEILQQLAVRFSKAESYKEKTIWHPVLPTKTATAKVANTTATSGKQNRTIQIPDPHYKKGDTIATREAFGKALAALGRIAPEVVALDADVKNSTYTEIFEADFPLRFFECYIAEQNMIGVAVGFESRGKIPFAATFGAFMSRAHDQIRMAAISQSALRLVGSHAGVSIGQDGPSQMALEDIALMRCLPESVVLYPCDGVSAHKLVGEMVNYTQGISYLRTTRGKTSVIYDVNEEFPIGGCKVLKESDKDIACLVTAGITVFEALKAHEQLQQEGISVAVIDLYSIKPLDRESLLRLGKKSGSTIITIEDHYPEGGLGEAVAHALSDERLHVHIMAVTKLPRSGKPEELLALVGIDAAAIVKKVKSL